MTRRLIIRDLLTSPATVIVEQEEQLEKRLSEQFNHMQSLPYRLYAVFVHVGSVEFGHYYIYIRDFARDVWRKYSDIEVSQVTDVAGEVFGETMSGMATGTADGQTTEDQTLLWSSPPTPYFLVYIDDATKDRLVEPVVRISMEDIANGKGAAGMTNTTEHEPDAPPLSSTLPPKPADGKGVIPGDHPVGESSSMMSDVQKEDDMTSGPSSSKDSSDTLTGA